MRWWQSLMGDPASVARVIARALDAWFPRPRQRHRADPLIPLPHGIETAALVPGAELLVIDGMGHDLPRGAWPPVIDAISALTARAPA